MNHLTYSYSPYRKQVRNWSSVARQIGIYAFWALVTFVVFHQIHGALIRAIAN